ncbi:MAG: hypothetical protein HY037_02355 [Nitrospirae bacterium]|nr:hypothetical protein [Candidatus Troglogloeales bacterium]
MKPIGLSIAAGLLIGAAVTWMALTPREVDNKGDKKEEQAASKGESRVQHGPQGETILRLNPEDQEHAGLKVVALEAAQMAPEVKGYGQVLDPGPLLSLIAERETAKAALKASAKEFERLKTLYAQEQNISARALETAEAAMKRDQILIASIQGRMIISWGKIIAQKSETDPFVHWLNAQEGALARIDLPLGESLESAPTAGHLALAAAEEHKVPAEFLGMAPNADAQMPGISFLFLLEHHPFPIGAPVTGWVVTSGAPQSGVTVPRAALVRHEGDVFVYIKTGDTTFERRAIALGHPMEDGWWVGNGLKPKEQVVIVGAQQLLSEEMKGQGTEE